MDESELGKFKERLLKEKESLESELKYMESTMESSQSDWSGETSAYDNHPGDLGTDILIRESDFSLARNARDTLTKVNDALKRIDEGTFGYCKVCGRPIERERLEALPYAELCIEDQKAAERSW